MIFRNSALSLIFGIALLGSQVVSAQSACINLFSRPQPTSRNEIVNYLVQNKLPGVIQKTQNGTIPVILVNTRTASKLQGFFQNSVGTTVAHQPNYKNDHGLIRLGHVVADLDSPGYRQRGEIHNTGISWVHLMGYIEYGGAGKRIEVAYSLTPEELKTAYIYAAMRRSAIVRVPFNFGGAKQDKSLPNFLNQGEHCFLFCASSYISSHIYEMKSRFQKAGFGNLETVLAREDIRKWNQDVNEKLWMTDPDNARKLSPALPFLVGIPEFFLKHPLFKQLEEVQQKEILNWVAAADISIKYEKLINELGFDRTGNGFSGMHNPRATAVLVYDAQVSDSDFMRNSYSSPGVFSTWKHTDALPLTPN